MALAVGELQRRFDEAKLGRDDLHEYQLDAVQWLYEKPRSALFIDVGLGKSVITITLLADLLKEGWRGRALVIAPLRVARATWPEELRLWKQGCAIDFSLIRAEDDDDEIKAVWEQHYRPEYERQRRVGEPPKVAQRYASRKAAPHRQAAKEAMRQQQALADVPLHIINLERVEWLVQFWEHRGRTTGETWPYDVIVIDESSKFKDFNTKRYKALKKTLNRVQRVHTLTASPAAEGYQHIFAQIFLLDQGRRFGRSVHAFMNRYFTKIRKARKWVIRKGSEKKISIAIADICMVLKKEDVRDQLKLTTTEDGKDWLAVPRKIRLNSELQEKYDRFEREMIIKFDDERIEALNGAVLVNKLLQITSGAVYGEDRRIIPVHDEKIEALRELIDELQGEPLLVGYWFGSSLSRLRKAFPQARVMTKSNVIKFRDDWNAGRIPIGLVQPGSAGHGLNLQKGPGRDLAIFDPLWSRELYEQFIGRLARQGQEQLVRVHQLMCLGTADEIVYDCLEDKGAGQERLFQYIREARARMNRRTEWKLAA